MVDTSDLFELKNFFLLGNYQAAINEAMSLSNLSEATQQERDIYVYRCYIAQGKYQLVLDEIKENASVSLLGVKLLATYLSKEENKEIVLVTLKEWMSDGIAVNNSTLQLVSCMIYFMEEKYEESMRCVYQANSMECLAMLVQIYLKINRPDLALKELKSMQQLDDDATVTQLATCWVNIALGGEKLQEALSLYQDLAERNQPTAKLLNGLAVCMMHMNRYAEAEKYLLQALEKNSSDGDAIVNLITCNQLQGKAPEIVNRQINQLRAVTPKHPWLIGFQKTEQLFDSLSKTIDS